MCGIAGIFDLIGSRDVDANLLHRMNESQFHRGPDENDPPDLLRLQRINRAGHSQVGLAGSRGTDAKSEIVFANVPDVGGLVRSTRPNQLASRLDSNLFRPFFYLVIFLLWVWWVEKIRISKNSS